MVGLSWYWLFDQVGTSLQFVGGTVLVLAGCSSWYLTSTCRWACLGTGCLFRLVPEFNLVVRLSWYWLFVQVGTLVQFGGEAVLVLAICSAEHLKQLGGEAVLVLAIY